MNPWAILELEPTSDTRAIKRAYAKKLKVTKPDEKPAEFQQLHQAYKIALYYAANDGDRDDVAESEAENELLPEIRNYRSLADEIVDPVAVPATELDVTVREQVVAEPVVPLAQLSEQEQLQVQEQELAQQMVHAVRLQEFGCLIERVQMLLQDNEKISDLKQWHFLAESESLLEDEFNWNLGRQIFRLLAEYGQPRVNSSGKRRYYRSVSAELVNYCEQLFSWRQNSYYLEQEFGEEFCRDILNKLHEPYEWQQPVQRARGGTMVHSEKKQDARPARKIKEPGQNGIYTFMQILFMVVLALHALRSCGKV